MSNAIAPSTPMTIRSPGSKVTGTGTMLAGRPMALSTDSNGSVSSAVRLVGVAEANGTGVRVRVGVRVTVAVKVGLKLAVRVAVAVGSVAVAVAVSVGVEDAVAVLVGGGVSVCVGVAVAVRVSVGVAVGGNTRTTSTAPSSPTAGTDWPTLFRTCTLNTGRGYGPVSAPAATLTAHVYSTPSGSGSPSSRCKIARMREHVAAFKHVNETLENPSAGFSAQSGGPPGDRRRTDKGAPNSISLRAYTICWSPGSSATTSSASPPANA